MRFESLLWAVLAMFLMGGVAGDGASLAGDVSAGGEYQAADGGSTVPPPPKQP